MSLSVSSNQEKCSIQPFMELDSDNSIYSLLGWLLAWSLEEKKVSPLLPLLLAWLAGTGDELIQGLLPDRVFDLRDILFNGLAGTAGTALFATGS